VIARSLWLVRHAPVEAEGRCYGQSDVPVKLPAGAAAGLVIASLPGTPALVVASPWARARHLAEAIAERLCRPLAIDARLAEMSFGAWEGRPYADLARDDGPAFARWMESWQVAAPPGGEALADFEGRVTSWLLQQRGAPPPGPWLVVTHAGPIRALRKVLRRSSWEAVIREPVAHLAIEPMDDDPELVLPGAARPA
jgi:alpha-ribazole phosphatase